jgi:quinoprotein glucose dehydrogenase
MNRTIGFSVACLFISVSCIVMSCKDEENNKDYSGWPAYAGGKEGNRYSSNDQINKENVPQLKVAWTFSSQDKDPDNRTQNQCNPIVVDGILYGTSPRSKLLALNAATGEQQWIFDPANFDATAGKDPSAFFKVNRGVVYWENENKSDQRIFYSVGSRTYAINAKDGKPVKVFGKGGYIDLSENLERETGTFNPYIASTTPGVLYKNLLIIGSRVAESADAAPGNIRAFDVVSGELKWTFHTIPHPGEVGYDTWPDPGAWRKLGGANSWAGMSLDEKRGIVYIPTGSVSGDFYGGIRKGTNLFGNSLIAVDAGTGKYKWHYQIVHHDLWDRDLPANPNLVTIHKDNRDIDVVAQITKHGYVFVFDRENGNPIFPIEEKTFQPSDLPGEEAWPTQPIPTLPEPFARQKFDEEDVSDLFPDGHEELLAKYRTIKYKTMFTPPSKEGVWIFPGFDGGGEWGGAAVDPETAIMYVNSSELPWGLTMIDVDNSNTPGLSKYAIGKGIYSRYCIACHGPDLKGNGPSYPSLVNLQSRHTHKSAGSIIQNGKNMMPAFKQINEHDLDALLSFLLSGPEKEPGTTTSKKNNSPEADLPRAKSILDEVPYTMTGYNRFLDDNGYPGIQPPWGTLNAIDLNSGKLLWKVPLGEYEALTKKGIPPTGTENYGGPLVTKGGLVFIAATKDEKIRAFDTASGEILWEANLPAAGYATPATYSISGKQYIVIACGGGKIGSKSGDSYVAFSIPEK